MRTRKVLLLSALAGMQIAAVPLAQAQELTTPSTSVQPMTENQKSLNEAFTEIRNFEAGQNSGHLLYAATVLMHIDLEAESGSQRMEMRDRVLFVWLRLLAILDRSIDPTVNSKTVAPKVPLPEGVSYFLPGKDARIAAIKDPQEREAYKKALKEYGDRERYLDRQRDLRECNGRVFDYAEAFIQSAYTSSAEDQRTLKEAIDREIDNPERKARLYKDVLHSGRLTG